MESNLGKNSLKNGLHKENVCEISYMLSIVSEFSVSESPSHATLEIQRKNQDASTSTEHYKIMLLVQCQRVRNAHGTNQHVPSRQMVNDVEIIISNLMAA